jgi:hypothetical protein
MIDWEPRIAAAQQQRSYDIQGQSYFRIPYGNESVEAAIIAAHHPCHDCAVRAGQLHVVGCDVEVCPACGRQAISCSCCDDGTEEDGTYEEGTAADEDDSSAHSWWKWWSSCLWRHAGKEARHS